MDNVYTKTAVQVFAGQDAAGNERKVNNHDAQVWGTEVENAIFAFKASGGVIFKTKAEMDAALDYDQYTEAWVLGDPDPGNNGIYQKQGASGSGSWTRLGDLPYSFIRAVNTGTGTGDAIKADTDVPIPARDGGALISLNIVADNTQDAPTVEFNGDGTQYTITDAAGTPVSDGGLTAGMLINGYKVGTTFRADMGPRGWSPEPGAENDGERRVLKLADWVGGHGAKPTETGYLSPGGLNPDISQAIDFRGKPGPAGDGSGDMVASVYDPQGIAGDAFDSANFTGRPTWRPKNVATLFANAEGLGYAAATPALTVAAGDIFVTQEEGLSFKIADPTATDEHVTITGGVKLYWVQQGFYSLEYFGLTDEASPTTDQSAQVQKMLNFLEGQQGVTVDGTATVGISSAIYPKSNTVATFAGLTIYLLDDFDNVTTTFESRFSIVANGITDTRIINLKLEGNSAAWGGLYPAVSIATRGFVIGNGSERVYFEDCVANDVNANGFLAYGGGDKSLPPKDCGFIRCKPTGCGIPIGQEVHSINTADVMANIGPQDILYDDCHADGNFGLYIAGGTFHVERGFYHSVRNGALKVYVGDALAPLEGTMNRPHFKETGVGTPLGIFHSIAANSANPSVYEKQQTFVVTAIEPIFEQEVGGSQALRVETGCRGVMVKPKFIGGANTLYAVATSLSGTFDKGGMRYIEPEFTKWGGAGAYAARIGLPTTLERPTFRKPSDAGADCIIVSSDDERIVIDEPVFGSPVDSVNPTNGISATGAPTNVRVAGAQRGGLTGTLLDITSTVAAGWDISGSNPPNLFDSPSMPRATTTQLVDAASDINTDAAKVEGYAVYVVNVGATVFADGSSDASVWLYAGGGTAYTPS